MLSGVVFQGWWQSFLQSIGVRLLFVGVVNLGILVALGGLPDCPRYGCKSYWQGMADCPGPHGEGG